MGSPDRDMHSMKTEAIRELTRAYDALHMALLDIDDGLQSDAVEDIMEQVRALMKEIIDSDSED